MILAAHQPQYLPWLGYFDKMDRVDRFVLLDQVQYKKNEWQNRNRVRTATGWQWLTVPVHYRFPMVIREVTVDESGAWRRKHREALRIHYGRTPHAAAVLPSIEALFDERFENLAALNVRSVRLLADRLGVRTPISLASEVPGLPAGADDRLVALCRHFGAAEYLAGAGGAAYMDMRTYQEASVRVSFQSFRHPIHEQAYPGFEPNLSAIDLLLNCGPGSIERIRRAREAAA
jgi:WbqC-like protein family